MNSQEDEPDQINMIKNHLKEVADYYSESFFDKTNMEGLAMEGINLTLQLTDVVRKMAEQIQHNEQCVTSIMDLVGLLILKCECFFQMQEENEQQIEDVTNKFTQQLEFERLSTLQFQSMYKEQQEKANNLFESMTDIENNFIDAEGQKQILQNQFQEILNDNTKKEADLGISAQLQKDYEQIISAFRLQNLDQASTIELFENAIEQFTGLKVELMDQIEKLTNDLNSEKATNRFLNKNHDSLQNELNTLQALNSRQSNNQTPPQRSQRASFLTTHNNLQFNSNPQFNNNLPSLQAINAYSSKISKDINNLIPSALKSDLQNHFLPEGNIQDIQGQKRFTILPAILAQQLLTLNPQIIANAYLDTNNSRVSEGSEIDDLESVASRLSCSSMSQKSTPYHRSRLPTIQEPLISQKDIVVTPKRETLPAKPKTHTFSSNQQNLVAQQKIGCMLELIPRTQSSFNKLSWTKVQEEERARNQSMKPGLNVNFYKKSQESDKTKQRMDPYIEFFILTSQCAKLNSKLFNTILRIEPQPLFEQAVAQKIPYNKWYEFIKQELEKSK